MSGREAQPVTTGGPITGCRARIPRQPTFEKASGVGRHEPSGGPYGSSARVPTWVPYRAGGLPVRGSLHARGPRRPGHGARGGKSNAGGATTGPSFRGGDQPAPPPRPERRLTELFMPAVAAASLWLVATGMHERLE